MKSEPVKTCSTRSRMLPAASIALSCLYCNRAVQPAQPAEAAGERKVDRRRAANSGQSGHRRHGRGKSMGVLPGDRAARRLSGPVLRLHCLARSVRQSTV